MLFVFFMAPGEDYNILIMSRTIEEDLLDKKQGQNVTIKAIGITGTTVNFSRINLSQLIRGSGTYRRQY